MTQRDQISIASHAILWVAGVGVGLLTLAFVLGVQVGKQSAALRKPFQKGVEEQLKDLPEPLLDQLKGFEGEGPDKLVPTPRVDAAAPKPAPKPEAAAPEKAPAPEAWTLQLVATGDPAEARKTAEKAKAAGFPTLTLKEKGQFKVRLKGTADRAALDKAAEKLKKAGFKPFAVRLE